MPQALSKSKNVCPLLSTGSKTDVLNEQENIAQNNWLFLHITPYMQKRDLVKEFSFKNSLLIVL